MPLPTMLTVADVAEQLHQSEQTVREWARQGRLPALKIGKSLLFPEAELLEALEAHRVGIAS